LRVLRQQFAAAGNTVIADQQIEELAVGGSLSASSGFDDTELAVLGLTTELLLTKQVDAALFKAVHQALGTKATIEVLMLINRWSGLALMINALEIDLDTAVLHAGEAVDLIGEVLPAAEIVARTVDGATRLIAGASNRYKAT